jgi:fumarate hydratase subunit alpha
MSSLGTRPPGTSAAHDVRHVDVSALTDTVERALATAASHLPPDYLAALDGASRSEIAPLAIDIIATLLDNARYAEAERIPTCQDTGMAVLFVEVGQDVHFVGGDVVGALNEGVRRAYRGLRKSVVGDPLLRANTGDNTPAQIHFEIVPGDGVRIEALMKGFGAESMSRMTMLPPSAGRAGVKAFIVETVGNAGPNACPPLIVGVGIGASFDAVGVLAKRALLRPVGVPSSLPHIAQLERELLAEINALGIGPQGLGGATTALSVHIEVGATHIAAIPVAVNLNCSAPRRAGVRL